MADDIGDWYARRAEEAHRIADELAEARDTLRGLRNGIGTRKLCKQQEAHTEYLERALERARYVGD